MRRETKKQGKKRVKPLDYLKQYCNVKMALIIEGIFISKTVTSLQIKVHECYVKPLKPRQSLLTIKENDNENNDESDNALLPEKYYSRTLPHKLPPRKEPMLVSRLPMLGYMEQSVATALTKALTAVGCFKPKYPFVEVSSSLHSLSS
ncbi:unnamed protein product [Porites lobata]|uniref:Uncharacterized protein n=1 Tax=Porites lobata TaxID=104759 RepID=A0ABN8MP36_9CNID|nr:unnamed protein product [Porites lobata]